MEEVVLVPAAIQSNTWQPSKSSLSLPIQLSGSSGQLDTPHTLVCDEPHYEYPFLLPYLHCLAVLSLSLASSNHFDHPVPS